MSAATSLATPATPLEDRGSTSVSAQVVARIAEQAASEVPHIGSDAGGVLGMGSRRDFPLPLAPALSALREHVRARVEHLTGLEGGRLDVTV